MSKKKVRNLTAAFWLGLFFMSFEPVFLWLLIISLVVLHPDEERSHNKEQSKDVVAQIRTDASKYGMRMPKKAVLKSLLVQVYRKFNKSVAAYPQLRGEYREILDEMWASLATHVDAEHWENTISKVCTGWPAGQEGTYSSIEERMKKVSEMTSQWDEAKREVRGGASV